MGTIYETGPNEYLPTPFSKALKEPIYRDAYPTMFVLPFICLIRQRLARRQEPQVRGPRESMS